MAWSFNKGAAAAAPALASAPASVTPPLTTAHPLPPPGAPLAPTPAAAAAPAGEPAKSRRGRPRASAAPAPAAAAAAAAPSAPAFVTTTAPAAAPTVPAPAPLQQAAPPQTVHIPEVQRPAAATTALSIPSAGLFSIFAAPASTGPSALQKIIEIGDQKGGEPNIFPAVFLTGGQNGGTMDADEMNEEGSNDDLPLGRDGFTAVLLGYRLISIVWPASANPTGPKHRPRFRSIIGSVRTDLVDLAFNAQKKYQMRTRPAVQYGPEPFYDQVGHPSITVEMLVFEPEAGIMGVRSTSTYDGVLETARAIFGAFPNGVPQPTPVTILPRTWQSKPSKKMVNGWPEHGYAVTQSLGQEGSDVWNAYKEFEAATATDLEFFSALQQWATTDITDQALAVFHSVVSHDG